jgi:predicted PurR-regulated permease PerM
VPESDSQPPVPWRTILASVGTVLVALLVVLLLKELSRILAWLVVAGFFAVVLAPAVDFCQHRLRMRRGLATSVVFFGVLIVFLAMLTAFIVPVAHQVTKFSNQLPHYIEDARDGKGTVGDLIKKYDLDKKVEENQDKIREAITGAGAPALKAVRGVFSTLLAFITILVLTFLMILRGPSLTAGFLVLFPERHREKTALIAADAAKAVSGYMLGNFLISIVAGVSTYVLLKLMGVPYPEVIALFVAFADLIPLVGATLGAVPTVGLSFVHSTTAGIVALIFYVLYQQFENHVFQPVIMSRTVDVNPLTVLVSVLVGVELFGFLGALLAIPAAGIVQVVVRNLFDPTTGRLKKEPTIGEDEVPIGEAAPEDAGA